MVGRQPFLPILLHRALVARQEGAGRVVHQHEAPARVALAIADGIEALQCDDRFLERAVAPLQVGIALAIVWQRADDLDPALREPAGQVAARAGKQNREIAAVDDALAARHAFVHQVAEVRVEFGRAAGDIDRSRRGAVERGEAQVDRLAAHHLGGAVGPGVDVAMAASHVAQLADVDLENVEGGRADSGLEVGNVQPLQYAQLLRA
jgi:hypothetical protein